MRIVIQRVESAVARLGESVVGEIDAGLVLFVGFGPEDDEAIVDRLAGKISRLRIIDEPGSTFGRSILDIGGEVLTVSQFTLYADASRGSKPNFSKNAAPEKAEALYRRFGESLRRAGITTVRQCPFATRLHLDQRNWGPFTMLLES